MADVPVPGGLDDITPQWLTAALRACGVDAEVTSVQPGSIGAGTGANGITARVTAEYAAPTVAPASFVVKLPATNPAVKEVAIRQRFYHNEIHFYTELAQSVGVRIPRFYYGGIDDDRGNYALLIEDMTPAVVGDDLEGCTWEEALLAVAELPKLHAPWWERPELASFSWLPIAEPNLDAAHVRFAETILPAAMENYGDTLSPTAKRVIAGYTTNFAPTMLKTAASPRTLTHSDYRLVNMLFGVEDGAKVVTVVDWQRVAVAKGPIDVAFFAVLSLLPEQRRAWERELVARYHEGLLAEGVADYSLEQCWRDYRLCVFGPSRITLSFAARPERDLTGPPQKRLQETLIERVAAAMEDLDLEEFL